MDSDTAKEVASAMRYSSHANPLTVSTHEPEMLLKVVDGHEHHRPAPRRRDHSGTCQMEIDILQHHNPECPEAEAQNLMDVNSEDIQGSYILVQRLPVETCREKQIHEVTGVAPIRSVLKKPVASESATSPVSKFSVHDEHTVLRRSRKGTRLNDPDSFDVTPNVTRSTIENIALLPKLGCSQPSFVARVSQKHRYDPSANPAANQKFNHAMVNVATTKNEKTPFYSCKDSEKPISSRHTDQLVYNTSTGKTKSPFDPCMDPTLNKQNKDEQNFTGSTNVYVSRTKLRKPFGKSPRSSKSDLKKMSRSKDNASIISLSENEAKVTEAIKDSTDQGIMEITDRRALEVTDQGITEVTDQGAIATPPQGARQVVHTCRAQEPQKLVYKTADGTILPGTEMPFSSPEKKQSVYAVVSKTSRVSFHDNVSQLGSSLSRAFSKKSSNISQGIKSANFSIRGVTYETFKDPCFTANKEKESVVMVAGVRGPLLPTGPFLPEVKINQEMGTMTSFLGCCSPGCDVQVLGKPRDNFMEESGSEDDLNVESQQTVATAVRSQVETDSKVTSLPRDYNQEPKQGCFKRVFLCGACVKGSQPDAVSQVSSVKPSGYVTNGSVRSKSVGSRHPASNISTKSDACCTNPSKSPSTATGKSVKSHSKQGHNAGPVSK